MATEARPTLRPHEGGGIESGHREIEEGMTAYIYRDLDGEPVIRKVRKSGKQFYWESFRPQKNEWVKGKDFPLPYNLPHITKAIEAGEIVFVTEGEKAADRMIELDFAATTTGGAKTWKDDVAHYFDGAKVVILPDNDEPGQKYATAVADSLLKRGKCESIKIVNLPGLDPKADPFDYLESGDLAEKYLAMINLIEGGTPEYEAQAEAKPDGKPRFRRGRAKESLSIAHEDVAEWYAQAQEGDQESFLCPCHADERKSLSASIQDGTLLVYCHAGCEQPEVWAAVTGHQARNVEADETDEEDDEVEALPELNEFLRAFVPAKADLAEVLDEIVAWIKKFVICRREEDYIACALYAAYTWRYPEWGHAPILYITSPTMESGKSHLVDAMMPLVYNPMTFTSASVSALFRLLDQFDAVLIQEEADALWKGGGENSEAIRALFNGGYDRGRPILRTGDKKSGFKPEIFAIFGPRIIAGIGLPPETVESRSVVITMHPMMPWEEVESYRWEDYGEEAWALRRRVGGAMWGEGDEDVLVQFPPSDLDPIGNLSKGDFPPGIKGRSADVWEPLLAVARAAGGKWPALADNAARVISGDRENNDPLILWLADLYKVFDTERAATAVLVQKLIELGGQWDQFNMSARGFSAFAKKLDLEPKQLKIDGIKFRGYEREWFEVWWERYKITRSQEGTVLPLNTTSTDTQSLVMQGSGPIEMADSIASVPVEVGISGTPVPDTHSAESNGKAKGHMSDDVN
jgi:hypothetical protein